MTTTFAFTDLLARMRRRAAERPRVKVLSYGGGLDSFAMLLHALDRGERPDLCIFVDVSDGDAVRDGEDPGEWPGTIRHLREVVLPLCEREGIEFVWLDTRAYPVRDARSLFAWLWKRGQIPVGGPTRICTTIAKVERFERWMSDRFPHTDVEVWIGFEAGEEDRVKKDPNAGTRRRRRKLGGARRHNRFPLVEARLCRCRCEELVRRHGLPMPPKSACVYCPYGSLADWQRLARELPDAFDATAQLEERKPPTSAGTKLSIMGFRTLKDAEGKVIGHRAPPLREYIKGTPRPRRKRCEVCGRETKASKVIGCGYDEARSV